MLNDTDSIIHPGHFPTRCKKRPKATETTWYMRVKATIGQTADSGKRVSYIAAFQEEDARFQRVVHVKVEEVANVTNTKQGSSSLRLSGNRA